MKKTIMRLVALIVILVGGFMGYMYLTQPEPGAVPPIPPADSSQAPTETAPVETAGAGNTSEEATPETDTEMAAVEADEGAETVASKPHDNDTLVIEIAGSTSGTIEILLNADMAPEHTKRLKALAKLGSYDGVVFHRVIDGFMAQTGDVKFGNKNGSISQAGLGGSDMADLKAEFSDQLFVRGVVGMARSSNPNSANSQFFIMFDEAAYLNGQYTIVGRVISGLDVVDTIKKGDQGNNGSVSDPDYMKSVRLKSDG